MTDSTTALCQQLAERLRARHWRLVTAESCTGGRIASACTDLAGSSDWFECGFVTYSNGAKMRDLAVPEATISEHGAVSEATVRAMVRGAARYGDIAVSVSGIAGPGGAVPGKPVGTVWLACGTVAEQISVLCHFSGDREAVRHQAVNRALTLLNDYLDK